jgi:hydrogenase maturation protease
MAGGVAGTTLIMGLGNVLLGDDGFGVHVIRHLKETVLPDNIRLIEGGVGGFNLLGYLEGVQRLVIVDAMIVDLTLGEVCLFQPGERLK